MAEFSKSTISIDAPIATVQEALFALDKYPEWSTQIKSAEALARDEQGRITKVKMSIDAGMMKDHAAWFESLPRVHSDAHRVYVHAGVLPMEALEKQPESITQWFRYPSGIDVGWRDKHVVHGHTPGVLQLANRTCLDGGKTLCCGVFDDDVAGGPVEMLWA